MKQNSIKVNAILNIIYTISNIIFPLITFPYASRVLLSDGTGKVSFFSAIANYLVILSSLGISTYGIRVIAQNRDNKYALSKTFHELLIINLIMTVIVSVVFVIIVMFTPRLNSEMELIIINMVLVFSTAFGVNWFYSGLEQYSYITKRSIFFKLISLVLIFIFVKEKKDYPVYAAITAFSSFGSYILNYVYSRKFTTRISLKQLDFKQHFKPMLVLFASILAVSVYTNLDTVMLGFINDDSEVGLYTVAVKIKWVLLNVVNSISAVLLPRLSYCLNQNQKEEFNKIIKKSTSTILMISFPLTVFFIFEAKDSILILGGENYIGATLCMQIIMPILIISGFSNIMGNQILIPSGKDACFMRAVVVGSLVDFIFNIVCMPILGCIGAALATLLAEITQMLIQYKYSSTYFKNNIQFGTISKIVTSTIIAFFIIAVIRVEISLNPFFNLLILFTVFCIVYLVSLIFLKEELVTENYVKLKNKIRF